RAAMNARRDGERSAGGAFESIHKRMHMVVRVNLGMMMKIHTPRVGACGKRAGLRIAGGARELDRVAGGVFGVDGWERDCCCGTLARCHVERGIVAKERAIRVRDFYAENRVVICEGGRSE